MWNQEYFLNVSNKVTKRHQSPTNVVSGSRSLVISTFPDNLLFVIIFLFI